MDRIVITVRRVWAAELPLGDSGSCGFVHAFWRAPVRGCALASRDPAWLIHVNTVKQAQTVADIHTQQVLDIPSQEVSS